MAIVHIWIYIKKKKKIALKIIPKLYRHVKQKQNNILLLTCAQAYYLSPYVLDVRMAITGFAYSSCQEFISAGSSSNLWSCLHKRKQKNVYDKVASTDQHMQNKEHCRFGTMNKVAIYTWTLGIVIGMQLQVMYNGSAFETRPKWLTFIISKQINLNMLIHYNSCDTEHAYLLSNKKQNNTCHFGPLLVTLFTCYCVHVPPPQLQQSACFSKADESVSFVRLFTIVCIHPSVVLHNLFIQCEGNR